VNKVRTKRIIKEIFFMFSDQILKVRRFISSFIYKTDVIFNINKL
jgi:hypothetical protein